MGDSIAIRNCAMNMHHVHTRVCVIVISHHHGAWSLMLNSIVRTFPTPTPRGWELVCCVLPGAHAQKNSKIKFTVLIWYFVFCVLCVLLFIARYPN
jgi:hypothetical protein